MNRTQAAITVVDRPMVLIPLEDYKALLADAGERPTPRLDRAILKARARFKKGKFISWKELRRAL